MWWWTRAKEFRSAVLPAVGTAQHMGEGRWMGTVSTLLL